VSRYGVHWEVGLSGEPWWANANLSREAAKLASKPPSYQKDCARPSPGLKEMRWWKPLPQGSAGGGMVKADWL
jgi:hypothetical protein